MSNREREIKNLRNNPKVVRLRDIYFEALKKDDPFSDDLQQIIDFFIQRKDTTRIEFLEDMGVNFPFTPPDFGYGMYIRDLILGLAVRAHETNQREDIDQERKNELILYDITRQLTNEMSRSKRNGKIEAIAFASIADWEHTYFKKWSYNEQGDACVICKSLENRRVPINEPFLRPGESVSLENGETWTYNFVPTMIASAHPYCECTEVIERERR